MHFPSSEAELLVVCARTSLSSAGEGHLREIISRGLDWAQFVDWVRRHRLLPLVHRQLDALVPDEIPEGIHDQWQQQLAEHGVRALCATAELLKLLDLLGRHNIEALPFKGPALAVMLYGDVALREYSDLDLFIRREDVFRAIDILTSAGFAPMVPMHPARNALLSEGVLTLCLEPTGLTVDLHWGPMVKRVPGSGTAFGHGPYAKVRMGGREVPTLSADGLLLVLSMHGAKHNWESLGAIADLARLIHLNRDLLDWLALLSQARSSGCSRGLLLGLSLAEAVMEVSVPVELALEVEREHGLADLREEVCSLLFGVRGKAGAYRRGPFYTRTMDRPTDRLRFLAALVFRPTATDWGWLRLPAVLFPLYRVVRPLRLTCKFLRLLARARRGVRP